MDIREETTEALNNYIDLCKALSQIPTMRGFAQHLVDSYTDE